MVKREFDSIYSHGFIRVACCVPRVRIADPDFNAEQILDLATRASEAGAVLALFPELSVSACTSGDLIQQEALLARCESALATLREASRSLIPVLVVGAPIRHAGKLFNCAVVIHRGEILGLVPKSHLSTSRELDEVRWFTPARSSAADAIPFLGGSVPIGADLLFRAEDIPELCIHVGFGGDLVLPIPPGSWGALAGATVLLHLAASNALAGRASERRTLCSTHSLRCRASTLYASAGAGESTTDLGWDGDALIHESGELLAALARPGEDPAFVLADVDLERLSAERMRGTTMHDLAASHRARLESMRTISFEATPPARIIPLERRIERYPYLPGDPVALEDRCAEVAEIQVQALRQRLVSTGLRALVIGISGGLDSTLALLAAVRVMDRLGWPRQNVLGFTMRGFGTSSGAEADAVRLMELLRIRARAIDIRPSALQMLQDIGHPFATGEPVHDLTFENVQAGERTSHLFRLANQHQGIVLGTGDLSELALGWNTYGVGDQMSHYNVNASIPKTLVQALIRWSAERGEFGPEVSALLVSILEREISPELIPLEEGAVQRTEGAIGPYDLQDFNLFYLTHFGFRPSKVAFLALHAWKDRDAGIWPSLIPESKRRGYDLPEIRRWLEVFLIRFFETSQFKRSAMPDGPAAVPAGSLSPRGGWRAPSDATARVWLEELEQNVPAEERSDP